jgi:hypothetical protein
VQPNDSRNVEETTIGPTDQNSDGVTNGGWNTTATTDTTANALADEKPVVPVVQATAPSPVETENVATPFDPSEFVASLIARRRAIHLSAASIDQQTNKPILFTEVTATTSAITLAKTPATIPATLTTAAQSPASDTESASQLASPTKNALALHLVDLMPGLRASDPRKMNAMQFPTFDDRLTPNQQFMEVDPTNPIVFRMSRKVTAVRNRIEEPLSNASTIRITGNEIEFDDLRLSNGRLFTITIHPTPFQIRIRHRSTQNGFRSRPAQRPLSFPPSKQIQWNSSDQRHQQSMIWVGIYGLARSLFLMMVKNITTGGKLPLHDF